MKTFLIMIFSLFLVAQSASAQTTIDTSAAPSESSYYDGPANTVFAPGVLLKLRSKSFYEITGKNKYANKIANPTVKVYKEKKRKYLLSIQGIQEPISAVKVPDVIESKIDGDFRGWDGTTTFKLLNGQVWVQDEIKTMFHDAIFRPTVYIYQADDGSYKMKVEGVDETVQVKQQ
ncbi:MAG: hypothetical protein ABI267_03170 [Ginsengibacter sp.]